MKRIVLLLTIAILAITMQAKNISETITGVGATQLEAIKNSIENVLSQKYSVWTAAMTKVVNDDITDAKTTSTTDPNANIKSYKILSLDNIDGEWKVTATVKTGRSSEYLQQIKRSYGLMQKTSPLDIPAMPLLPAELEDEDQQFQVGQSLDKKLIRAIVDQFRA